MGNESDSMLFFITDKIIRFTIIHTFFTKRFSKLRDVPIFLIVGRSTEKMFYDFGIIVEDEGKP